MHYYDNVREYAARAGDPNEDIWGREVQPLMEMAGSKRGDLPVPKNQRGKDEIVF
jgi:hypothetical protein